MTRIVVTTVLAESALAILRATGADVWAPPDARPLPAERLHAVLPGASGVVATLHDRVDDALVDAAGAGLRVVANVAVGYDNVDLPAARARGVIVTNTPGVLSDATADLTLALMLAVTRRVAEGDRLVRAGGAWDWSMDFMVGAELRGRTLGIVGLGGIGRAVAGRARAFGMDVIHTRRSPGPEPGRVELGELLERAHVVSLHCPLTPETRHLIDAAALARMRPDAYLVNTARGPIVDEAALVEALRQGRIAGAALDVLEREPRAHPGLAALPNVVLTPHIGSATLETRTAMAELACRNVAAVLAGAEPLTPIRG
ncbi:MAG: 2-hydroxyacid dehydrogenase [Thermoleophilia bacterium]